MLNSPGFAFAAANEVGQRAHRRVRAHREHHRLRGHFGDGREVFQGIEGHLRVEPRVDGEVRRLPHAQRVAVGRGLGHRVQADVAGGAGLVVDDDRPVVQHREPLGNEARGGIGAAARREGHHQAHGLLGPAALRVRHACGLRQRGERGGLQKVSAVHVLSPWVF
jgi:hypothetical protein